MFRKYLFFFLVCTGLNLLFLPLKALKNEIIVKIDNSIITAYEIKNKIKTSLILSNQVINQSNIDKNKKRALIYLIDLKLKRNELMKYKIDVSNINIHNHLLSLSSNNIDEFKDKFQQLDINFELFVNEIKIVIGDEWYAGNLSYHLTSRPVWMNELKNKTSEINSVL